MMETYKIFTNMSDNSSSNSSNIINELKQYTFEKENLILHTNFENSLFKLLNQSSSSTITENLIQFNEDTLKIKKKIGNINEFISKFPIASIYVFKSNILNDDGSLNKHIAQLLFNLSYNNEYKNIICDREFITKIYPFFPQQLVGNFVYYFMSLSNENKIYIYLNTNIFKSILFIIEHSYSMDLNMVLLIIKELLTISNEVGLQYSNEITNYLFDFFKKSLILYNKKDYDTKKKLLYIYTNMMDYNPFYINYLLQNGFYEKTLDLILNSKIDENFKLILCKLHHKVTDRYIKTIPILPDLEWHFIMHTLDFVSDYPENSIALLEYIIPIALDIIILNNDIDKGEYLLDKCCTSKYDIKTAIISILLEKLNSFNECTLNYIISNTIVTFLFECPSLIPDNFKYMVESVKVFLKIYNILNKTSNQMLIDEYLTEEFSDFLYDIIDKKDEIIEEIPDSNVLFNSLIEVMDRFEM